MPKPTSIEVKPESLEYAPTGGTKVQLDTFSQFTLKELRIAVAELYNSLYRQGKESQYTFEVFNELIAFVSAANR